jgi:hypothetical protein
MNITAEELAEMERDLLEIEREKELAVIKLQQLYDGDAVVLPRSKEHAISMIRVASFYLDTSKDV